MNNKETIEEAADRLFPNAEQIVGETYTAYKGFIEGAKWQAERMYSEEEVLAMLFVKHDNVSAHEVLEWFKQYKNK